MARIQDQNRQRSRSRRLALLRVGKKRDIEGYSNLPPHAISRKSIWYQRRING